MNKVNRIEKKIINSFSGLAKVKYNLLLVFLIISLQAASGQITLEGKKFFENNINERPELSSKEKRSTYFPWIEEYELRTETHDFYLDEQEYTFRMTPSSFLKRKRQKELLNHLIQKPQFEWEESFCRMNKQLHEDWLSLYLIEREREILDKKRELFDKKANYFEAQKKTLLFKASDLVKMEIDQSDALLRENNLETEQRELKKIYSLEDTKLDFSQFIDIESMILLVDGVPKQQAPDIQESQYEYQQIEKEISLEKAEKFQFFDFFQLRYNGPHEDLWREKASLGIGLNLPNSGNRKLKIQELQIEKEELQDNMRLEEWKLNKKLSEIRTALSSQFDRFRKMKSTFEEERKRLEKIENKLISQEDYDMELIIKIQERKIENDLSLLREEGKLYENLLDYIDECHLFCTKPYRFYLDNSFVN